MGKHEKLIQELELDINRIASRNLGRDDRIISDHGREVRYPFLDETLINFLNGLPINFKCDLNLDRGSGEKRLLRLAAQSLGLLKTATHLKRALQFGTKIAKLENRKESANSSCDRLK